MKVRVSFQGISYFVEVPTELAVKLHLGEGGEFELVEARPEILLLLKNGNAAGLNAVEVQVLRKLEAVRYEQRIPEQVDATLSASEKDALSSLIAKGHVKIYRGGRYEKTGVYDISKEAYGQARNLQQPLQQQKQQNAEQPLTWEEHLAKYGYVIIENEAEAKGASTKLEQGIKAGEVMGVRGFDRKFYIAQKRFYEIWSVKVNQLLKKQPAATGEIAVKLQMSEVAARVQLELMREEGEVIEKQRGVYTAI